MCDQLLPHGTSTWTGPQQFLFFSHSAARHYTQITVTYVQNTRLKYQIPLLLVMLLLQGNITEESQELWEYGPERTT